MSNVTLQLNGYNVSAIGDAGNLVFVTSKKTALLAQNKLPEFIREEYPALVTFVKAYYKYLERLESIRDLSDIDSMPAKYLSLYHDTMARGFSDPEFLSIRKFIQANKDFFSRKGTPDAFRFFFRAYFNEEIEIHTPDYLIASGGEIAGLYFTYVTVQTGTIQSGETVEITSSGIIYKIEVQRVEQLGTGVFAIYYIPPRGFSIAVGNKGVSKNTLDEITSSLTVTDTPKNISISDPGKYWQIGQTVLFPTTDETKNTIARVVRVDADTGIAKLEIVEQQYPHSINQSLVVSPFPAKPSGGTFTMTVTGTTSKTYTLGITDATQGFSETISGISYSSYSDYFLEDYVSVGYTGAEVIADTYSYSVVPEQPRTDYTLQMWSDSRSLLSMNFGAISRERTYYLSEKSLISSPNTRLHDNLYYQAYSYSIETTKDIEDYRSSLDLIHPAGVRFSADMVKSFSAYKYIGYGDPLYAKLPYWAEESSPSINDIVTDIYTQTITPVTTP